MEGLLEFKERSGWTFAQALGLLQTVACVHLSLVWWHQPVCGDIVDYYRVRAGGNSHLCDHVVLLLVRHRSLVQSSLCNSGRSKKRAVRHLH